MKKIRTNIYLTEAQNMKLKEFAIKEEVSKATLVRRAVDAYLESQKPKDKK